MKRTYVVIVVIGTIFSIALASASDKLEGSAPDPETHVPTPEEAGGRRPAELVVMSTSSASLSTDAGSYAVKSAPATLTGPAGTA